MTQSKNIVKSITFIISFLFLQIAYSYPNDTIIGEVALPIEIKSINYMVLDKHEQLWIATGQGLYCLKNNQFTRYYNPGHSELYCINTVNLDNLGNMWCGTYNGNLVKLCNNQIIKSIDIKKFCKTDNYLITSISINKDTTKVNAEILLTTAGGEIFAYDTVADKVNLIKSPPVATIYSIIYGYSPNIWLCTSDGFYTMERNSKWAKKTNVYTAYGLIENNGTYWAIGRDESKKAILMLYYNENTEKGKPKYLWKTLDLEKLNSKFARFYDLGFTSDEIVWITSDEGLICYNPLNAAIKAIKIEANQQKNPVQHIVVQNDKLIWISTSGKKLFRIDIK